MTNQLNAPPEVLSLPGATILPPREAMTDAPQRVGIDPEWAAVPPEDVGLPGVAAVVHGRERILNDISVPAVIEPSPDPQATSFAIVAQRERGQTTGPMSFGVSEVTTHTNEKGQLVKQAGKPSHILPGERLALRRGDTIVAVVYVSEGNQVFVGNGTASHVAVRARVTESNLDAPSARALPSNEGAAVEPPRLEDKPYKVRGTAPVVYPDRKPAVNVDPTPEAAAEQHSSHSAAGSLALQEAVRAPEVSAEALPHTDEVLTMPNSAEAFRDLLRSGNEQAQKVAIIWLRRRSSDAVAAVWQAHSGQLNEGRRSSTSVAISQTVMGTKYQSEVADSLVAGLEGVSTAFNGGYANEALAHVSPTAEQFVRDILPGLKDETKRQAAIDGLATLAKELELQDVMADENVAVALSEARANDLQREQRDATRQAEMDELVSQLVADGSGKSLEAFASELAGKIPEDYFTKHSLVKTIQGLGIATSPQSLGNIAGQLGQAMAPDSYSFAAKIEAAARGEYRLDPGNIPEITAGAHLLRGYYEVNKRMAAFLEELDRQFS